MPQLQPVPAPRLVLPGGRFAAERAGDLPRLVMGVASLLGPRAWFTTRRDDARRAERQWADAAARWLYLNIDVKGLEHIDPARTYVIAPLHESFVDAVALLNCLPLDLRFVARDELAAWPVLGRALRAGGHPLVSPERAVSAYRTMRRAAPAVLDGGESLVVFPQGSVLGVEAAFSAGAFRLAAAMRRPLLPIVLTGTHRVWDYPFNPTVRFGRTIYVAVLPPIEPDEVLDARRPIEQAMKRHALDAAVPPRRFVPERDGWWDDYAFSIDPDFADLAHEVGRHRSRVRARRTAA